MRILVFGAGSLGCAVGGMLAQAHEVTLVGRKENMNAIRQHGLRLTGAIEAHVRIATYETAEALTAPDLVIIATKAYHTAQAVDALRAVPWPETPVLTLQNGLGNLELLRAWKGSKAFGGTTTMGAVLVSPGEVRVSGLGRTVVGSDMDETGAKRIAESFASCGIKAETSGNITGEIWAKAIVNSCINPLTAILRVPNGRLLESETLVRLMSELCAECVEVARACRIALPEGAMTDRVLAVARDTAANRSSMLRDIELDRRTEIGQMNVMMCEIGSSHGIRTPLNRALSAMIEALGRSVPGERLIS